MRRSTMVVLLAILAAPAQAGVIYTPNAETGCQDYSKPQFGNWVCLGPGGYAVGFWDEGNLAGVAIGPRSAAPHNLTSVSQFRGARRVFGEKLEWHVRNGKPYSAVLRVWKTIQLESDNEKELQQLEVYAIGKGKTCLIALVDAALPEANARASAYAEQSARMPCIKQ